MKLYEVLRQMNLDTLIAIHDVDSRQKTSRIQYQKLRNIKWEKIRNALDRDVMQISVHKEKGGVFITVHDRERLHKSLDNWDLVDKYFKRKDQRSER